MTDPELLSTILAFCGQWFTASLSTVDDDGKPHGANVQVAADRAVNLYFISSPNSAHSRHIAARGDAALTIYAHTVSPAEIHGVQMHGRCAAITDSGEYATALAVYLKQFPFIERDDALLARVQAEQLFRFSPSWLRWIDNRVKFGFKKEMVIALDNH